jgi:prophage regulatory protein
MQTKLPEKFKTSLRLTEPADSPGHGDPPPARLLRFPTVRERTGLSRSTIWRLERNGLFPRHRQISLNAVAWSEKDIVDWIQAKIGR